MNAEDTAILHPGSYSFRSTVAGAVTRAVAVNDVPERAWLATFMGVLSTTATAGNTLQRSDMAQDTTGYSGKHLKWLSSDILYRATLDADIKTDVLAITAAALLLL